MSGISYDPEKFDNNWKKAQNCNEDLIRHLLIALKQAGYRVERFEIADFDKDTKEATDLVVYLVGGDTLSVALRTRDAHKYFIPFNRDITIRCDVPSGNRTEYDKIFVDGCGDLMFYAFCDYDLKIVVAYRLIDFQALRLHVKRIGKMFVFRKGWNDNSTFWATNCLNLPAGCVVVQRSNAHKDAMQEVETATI